MRRLSFTLCLLLSIAGTVHAADNYLGIWKLNLPKSKYSPGPPAESQTTKLDAVAGGGLREVGDRVNADDSKTHWEFSANLGKIIR